MYYEWGFNGSSSSKNLRGPNIYIYIKLRSSFFPCVLALDLRTSTQHFVPTSASLSMGEF